jgi:sarcosine oxidase
MTLPFHTIVAGLGAMGSATLFHLAARGARVAGFDRFRPPHSLGSSHGETRMIREAYYEDPRYVPLVRRAYALWHELSARAGAPVIVETGGVFAGPPAGGFIAGIRRAAREHGIAVETLAPGQASRRFSWLRVEEGMEIVAEPRAGFVYAERSVASHLALAAEGGAEIHTDEPVTAWRATGDGMEVETPRGRYLADRLVLCTGAWLTDTLASIGVAATVERQSLFWFAPREGRLVPRTVWAVEFEPGKLLYGFPAGEQGVKVAIHYGGAPTTAETIDRTIRDEDARRLRKPADRYLSGLLGEVTRAEVCMYTNTPDLHFVFGAHPGHADVLVVSACSGHGFKFSSAIGEAAAQWALEGAPRLDLSLFAIARFGG